MAESNKTEKATPKKKRDERKKGNAFKSKEIVSIATLIIGFVMISKLGGFIMIQVKSLYLTQLTYMKGMYELTVIECLQLMRESMLVFFIATLPILLALTFVGITMSGVQSGFLVSGELLKFKYNRISFIEGCKRILSLRSLVELTKSIIKVAVVMWVIYSSVRNFMVITPDMLNASLDSNLSFMPGPDYGHCL